MKKKIILFVENQKRLLLGAEKITQALEQCGETVAVTVVDPAVCRTLCLSAEEKEAAGAVIYVGVRRDSGVIRDLEDRKLLLYHTKEPKGEGFYLSLIDGEKLYVIAGGSESGALYGCLEFAQRIQKEGELPWVLAYGDEPEFRLRGPAIGLQLTKVQPPRLTYEYPITPERFPWFYDKALWEKFLDQMLMERCNCLYLWTGLPFSSLVKLEDYPEALEVTEEEYDKNRQTFHWLAEECDRRGIWLVLKFYSIHIPLPLAQKYGVELLQSQITPLNRDYTYKSIVAFIKEYPNIGLMVCLGEALRGTQNKADWFLETIIPAVKEGVSQAHLEKEPPLILRGHDCDPNMIMEKAVHLYGNIYTMWKYNGESLTNYTPTGKWQDIHKRLSSHGQTHIMNVHVLADLEPFRYASPSFIQKSIQAGRDRLGVNALHLYPLFFWDWPYSADKTEPRTLQMDRDWLWYKAWFRYAWKPDRDETVEKLYWTQTIADYFGCDAATGEKILKALSYAGECTPRILRRVGITEGNRQTLSLGMTMSQFTNVKRYRPNLELWHSVSTPGEQPDTYVQKELKGEAHFGETPKDMLTAVTAFAREAYACICAAKANVTQNRQEFEGYVTDIEAIYDLSLNYAKKLEASFKILEYKYTMDPETLRGNLDLLREAIQPWEESLEWYKKLVKLTEKTYLYANSMQTPQRKIPFANGEKYGHWAQCLPEYEKELANFKRHLAEMEAGKYPCDGADHETEVQAWESAEFELLSTDCSTYRIQKGSHVFTDMVSPIVNLAGELDGLTGIHFGLGHAITDGAAVKIRLLEDAQVLIAYMNSKGIEWLQVPDLETNTHADDRGGLAVLLKNAMQAEGCPDMDVHAFRYEKGVHELYMGTGGYSIVGIIPADVPLHARNAGFSGETLDKLDWLYE